jgi:diguanylate cyclase (GGDEF)-like protein
MMEEVLSQQLAQCRKLEQPCSIFIIDIDHFKNINDVYGHLLGDAILEKIGMCIKSLTRADDFSCRLGGDEILLSFKNMPAQQAVKKAQFIRRMLGQLYVMKDKQKISTTVSIGIATFPIHGDCIHAIDRPADAALYRQKNVSQSGVLASEVEAKLPGPK